MGLLDFLSDIPIVGSVSSAIDAGLDSIGLSQHGRDQYVSQENQRELFSIQNQYNQENFDRQFAAENAEFDRRYQQYQSPQALVRQYSEAGLNPSAVLSGGKAGFGGVGSAVNPSSVSVPSVSPSAPMQISQKSSSDYIDAISRMKLNDAQQEEIFQLLKGKIREQDDTHKWQSVLTAQKMFEYELDKKYGDNKRANEIANLVEQGLLMYMQGQEAAANVNFLKAKEMLAQDEHKFNQVKYPKYGLYLDAMIQEAKAQAARDYASASESRENAEQTRLFNKIYGDKRYQHSIISQAVSAGQKAIEENKLTKKQVEYITYMVEQAAYANDMKEFAFWSEQIQSYMSSVGQAASAFYGAGALRELIKMRQFQQLPPTSVKGFK